MAKVHIFSWALVLALLCGGCSTTQVSTRSMAGVSTGAAVGNMLGSAVGGLIGDNKGGWHGAYRGSSIGSILGTVAGASVGYAITSAKHEKRHTEKAIPYSPLDRLYIENVHFISEDQQQLIRSERAYKITFEITNKGTECATTVIPKVKEISGKKRLNISPSLVIDRIEPYSGIRYTATVRTGKKIKTGEAVFRISISDAENREYDWLEFAIPTER